MMLPEAISFRVRECVIIVEDWLSRYIHTTAGPTKSVVMSIT